MEAALARRRRADRLHLAASPPCALPDDDARPTRPRRWPKARPSAPTSAARWPPSGWSSGWSPSEGLPAVIVNPSTPIGPRDVKPTPTGRIIVEAATGRMPAFVDTGLNLVHVDDVAEGHLLALEQGPDRRALHPGRPGRAACARCWPTSPRLTGRKPPTRRACRAAPLYPLADDRRGRRPGSPARSRS